MRDCRSVSKEIGTTVLVGSVDHVTLLESTMAEYNVMRDCRSVSKEIGTTVLVGTLKATSVNPVTLLESTMAEYVMRDCGPPCFLMVLVAY